MINRLPSSFHASSLTAALRAGASLATLSLLGLSGTAFAQTAAAAPQGSEAATQDATGANSSAADGAQEIVVTGIRASLQSARNRKRDAEQVVDSITAQDIGALPDRSVSEALQRVPGVTLQRTNENRDPARLSSEGGGVFIRGLSWVRSELNGRDVFSASNGRGLSFEDVSSDLLVGVDVYKNPSAELVEGGIGGIVNLRTRKPFDSPGYVFALSGDANYADLRKKTFWSGNALASGRWQTPLGEMGLLLSYSINNIGNRTDSITAGRYDRGTLTAPQDGLAAGTNVYIPAGMGFRRIDWQQKRTAFDGSFQWKPTDTLQLTFEALISKATPHDIEYAVGDYDTPSSDNSSYKFGPNHELQSGTITNRNLNLDTRAGSQDKKTQDFSGNLRWTPNENWSVTADLQYIKSTAKVYSMTAFTGASIPTTIAFDFSGDDPSMTFTPTNSTQSLTNKNDYWWAAAMDHIEDNEAHEWASRADVEYTFTDSDFLKSFRVGGRYTDRNATTRQSTYNWAMLSAQYWDQSSPVFLNQTGRAGGPQSAGLPNQTSLINYNNFFRGKVPQPGAGFWFPSAGLVQNGTGNAYDYLKNTEKVDADGRPTGWTPLSNAYDQNGGTNNQTERTYAGYALMRFGMDQSPIGKFDGNIGVRVIRTENSATGTPISVAAPNSSPSLCVVGTPITTGPRAGQTVNATDCANYAAAFAFAGGKITQATVGDGSYTDVLPSLNLRFFLKDNLQLRFAAAKAIVRPTFAQLNPYVQLGFSFDSVTGIATGVGANGQLTGSTGSAGNPNLKPTRSNQFDLSLEYYFGRSNSITLAGFYKDISNYIFAGTTQQTFTSNGQTLTFNVTQQTNGSKGKIKGFELGYTQFFDMLPGALGGLGFSGNFTFVDSSGGKNTAVNVFDSTQTGNAGLTLPLEGLSKTSYNAALVYEKYGISARAAYNWRSHYLLTTSAANLNYPVWSESYGQLDASVLYSLNKHIKIGVQGYNLLNSRTFLDVGDPSLKPRYSWTDTDRRFAFLFRSVF